VGQGWGVIGCMRVGWLTSAVGCRCVSVVELE